ncbi:MAG TPA: hypothetical protein VG318_11640 [Actinomycetota bacterium]|nr:hypothetical protein [Actinomycetota bacterium]
MNPFLKKVLAAVAIKEGIEKVQEMRRPKPSLWSRVSPIALVAALGGALFYLNKSGKLGSLVGGSKGDSGTSGSNGSGTWNGGAGATSTTSPGSTPTTV